MFIQILIEHSVSKHSVENLIRGRVLRRLIWLCTVCLCPKNNDAIGLYGLITLKNFVYWAYGWE